MAEDKGNFDRVVEELKQLRDELQLQMHLAAKDARDEWEELERKWEPLRARLDVVGKAAEQSAEDVGDALEIVADELKKGYARLRSLL
jgi:N-acyl-D-aspartate/D-glutamate deacylase